MHEFSFEGDKLQQTTEHFQSTDSIAIGSGAFRGTIHGEGGANIYLNQTKDGALGISIKNGDEAKYAFSIVRQAKADIASMTKHFPELAVTTFDGIPNIHGIRNDGILYLFAGDNQATPIIGLPLKGDIDPVVTNLPQKRELETQPINSIEGEFSYNMPRAVVGGTINTRHYVIGNSVTRGDTKLDAHDRGGDYIGDNKYAWEGDLRGANITTGSELKPKEFEVIGSSAILKGSIVDLLETPYPNKFTIYKRIGFDAILKEAQAKLDAAQPAQNGIFLSMENDRKAYSVYIHESGKVFCFGDMAEPNKVLMAEIPAIVAQSIITDVKPTRSTEGKEKYTYGTSDGSSLTLTPNVLSIVDSSGKKVFNSLTAEFIG